MKSKEVLPENKPVIKPKLIQGITKLRIMAQLVIEECDKVMHMMDKPVSKIVVNKERRRAETKSFLIQRMTKKQS